MNIKWLCVVLSIRKEQCDDVACWAATLSNEKGWRVETHGKGKCPFHVGKEYADPLTQYEEIEQLYLVTGVKRDEE